MLCPQCKTPLTMSDRQGVEIDYCPQCRGVWLDRGELDKIIERANGEMQPQAGNWSQPQQPPPQPMYGGEGYDKRYDQRHHKKKSFWSEIFD